MACAEFLVVLFYLLKLLLEDQNIKVSRTIVGVKEFTDSSHGLFLGTPLSDEKLSNNTFKLIISRVNRKLFQLTLSLRQTSEKGFTIGTFLQALLLELGLVRVLGDTKVNSLSFILARLFRLLLLYSSERLELTLFVLFYIASVTS